VAPFAVAGGDVTGWQAFRFGMLLGAIYGLLQEPRAFACCGCPLVLIALFAILLAGAVVVVYGNG